MDAPPLMPKALGGYARVNFRRTHMLNFNDFEVLTFEAHVR